MSIPTIFFFGRLFHDFTDLFIILTDAILTYKLLVNKFVSLHFTKYCLVVLKRSTTNPNE